MRVQYEEKTFESYFNAELSQRGIFFFPPGQVQEGSMGADAVVMCRNRRLWRRFGYPYLFTLPFAGASYREMAEEMEKYLQREITDVPDIRGNIFFQYKRSQFMVLKSAEEWSHWNEPYYRYDIYQEQQLLLERLHSKFGSSVLILYAAPAVQDVGQLVDLHITGKVIANTNFRPAHELSGHRRNTFKDAGGHSWACSDPVRLNAFAFDSAITELKLPRSEAVASFKTLGSSVHEVLVNSSYRKPYENLRKLYGVGELAQRAPLLASYLTMTVLREITGIQWVAVHAPDA